MNYIQHCPYCELNKVDTQQVHAAFTLKVWKSRPGCKTQLMCRRPKRNKFSFSLCVFSYLCNLFLASNLSPCGFNIPTVRLLGLITICGALLAVYSKVLEKECKQCAHSHSKILGQVTKSCLEKWLIMSLVLISKQT